MLNGLFKEEYTQPNLTLHTERQVWNPAEDKETIYSNHRTAYKDVYNNH